MSMTFCGTAESSDHSVLGISQGHLVVFNNLNLSIYRGRPASATPRTIILFIWKIYTFTHNTINKH